MIVFENPGTISAQSITTFGASSKTGENAIGFFGTGLKYAIAILLRCDCEITIYSGGEVFTFSKVSQQIRNDVFDVVHMNGQPLSFTTELGKTWEPWQALRELYCNCKDEGGTAFEAVALDFIAGMEGPEYTAIVCRGRSIHEAWADRAKIILGSKPLFTSPGLEIHPGSSNFIYYRGIRALELDCESAYTYNICQRMDLTEDRTIKHSFYADNAVRAGVVAALDDATVCERILTAGEHKWEHHLAWQGVMPSDMFLEVATRLMAEHHSDLSASAKQVVRTFGMRKLVEAVPATLDSFDNQRLSDCVSFCRCLGFAVDDYPIVVTEFLGENVMGRAENGTIYVSKQTFMRGSKMLAGTLLEEFIHLRYKLKDCDRGMQNFLFDLVVSLGERSLGRPL